MVPHGRNRYLAEIAETVRATTPRPTRWPTGAAGPSRPRRGGLRRTRGVERDLARPGSQTEAKRDPVGRRAAAEWDELRSELRDGDPDLHLRLRIGHRCGPSERPPTRRHRHSLPGAASGWRTSPSGTRVPRVALPRFADRGELLRWLRSENLPGRFPFTAGVFPFKRKEEQPTRMFAGEGDPSGPTGGSICWRTTNPPPGFRRPLTPLPSMAATRMNGPISTARSGPRAYPWPPSTI